MATSKVTINRAPVMTLWATVVAEHLGFDHGAALTMAKVVTGLNAQAKGQRLGIYEPGTKADHVEKMRRQPVGETMSVALLGRAVPVANTNEGLRALDKGKPVSPASVERYLHGKFGANLPDVLAAMNELAGTFAPAELADHAYYLYEKFRPVIPAGVKGWGAAGELDLDYIRALAPTK
jgi:hypothetical protein